MIRHTEDEMAKLEKQGIRYNEYPHDAETIKELSELTYELTVEGIHVAKRKKYGSEKMYPTEISWSSAGSGNRSIQYAQEHVRRMREAVRLAIELDEVIPTELKT